MDRRVFVTSLAAVLAATLAHRTEPNSSQSVDDDEASRRLAIAAPPRPSDHSGRTRCAPPEARCDGD